MNSFQRSAQLIRDSSAILVTAGAGMGVDSGLPDFRGNQGFWRAYPAFKNLGWSFYDLANPRWFHDNPRQAWGFYGHRLQLYRSTIPHAGFEVILKWSRSKPLGYFVFTSNVDCHFQNSGFSEHRIVECHGSFSHLQCSGPCSQRTWKTAQLEFEIDESTMLAESRLPVCLSCQQVARPNILMFGDWDWIGERTERQTAEYMAWLESIPKQELVIIEVGAGTSVPTVRSQSERIAQAKSAPLIRINVREDQGPAGTISINRSGLAALQEIDRMM